jgi:hypothetical protein
LFLKLLVASRIFISKGGPLMVMANLLANAFRETHCQEVTGKQYLLANDQTVLATF